MRSNEPRPVRITSSRRTAKRTYSLALDSLETRQVLSTVTVRLADGVDPDGNGVVLRRSVAIVGRADPGSKVGVDLDGDGRFEAKARAGADGSYRATLPVAIGRHQLKVEATAPDGTKTETALRVTRGDVVVNGNQTLLDVIRSAGTNPPVAAHDMAMVQLAVGDAVSSVAGSKGMYFGWLKGPKGASSVAAAAAAAYRVEVALYPAQTPLWKSALDEALATVPAGSAKSAGVRYGTFVGNTMVEARAHDGAAATVDYQAGTGIGEWVPTPPRFLPALAPQMKTAQTFVVGDANAFLPAPPPALDGPEYAAALNQVESVGGAISATRTADETALAHFWADVPGSTFTPPGHWNQIAQDAALQAKSGLLANAKLFARLDAALGDAGICCWDAKYTYNFWRPVTAIREADLDGNVATTADPTWTPLWATPNFPGYTSGHSTFSGAASTVLEAAFGKNFAFTDQGDPTQGFAPRGFTSFAQAADEAGWSRVVGGIHFQFDNLEGLAGGRRIGSVVVATLK